MPAAPTVSVIIPAYNVGHLTQANSCFRSNKLKVTIPLLKVAPRLVLSIYNLRDRFVYEGHSKF